MATASFFGLGANAGQTWEEQWFNAIYTRLLAMDAKLNIIIRKEINIMATLADVSTAVTNEKTVEDSVVTLLQQLAAQLKAAIAANDPAAVQAIVDQINANAQTLADAVTQNTPSA